MSGWPSIVLLVMLYGSTCGERAHLNPGNDSQEAKTSLQIVKRSAGDPFSRRSPVDKNFIRFGRSFHEVADRGRAKNMMSYARVSRAVNDNFMRFGRPDAELEELYFSPTVQSSPPYRYGRGKDNFMRFGRGKDNFMRFGRKDNFMRFGRGKDNFMRFGRAKDNFMRFGRAKDNFMRFGKSKPDNFMRFGRAKDNFMRFGKSKPDNFMRFGRPDSFMRFGRDPSDVKYPEAAPKSEDGFLRLNRADEESDEGKVDDLPENDQGDLDLQADKPKNGPVIRIKRDVQQPTETTLWQVEENSKDRLSRDSDIVEEINISERPSNSEIIESKSLVAKRSIFPEVWVVDDDPIGVDDEEFEDGPEYVDKRSGDSKFIRFG